MSVTPLNFPLISNRRATPEKDSRPSRTRSGGTLSTRPTAAAAAALRTLWITGGGGRSQMPRAFARVHPELPRQPLELHIGNHEIGLTGRAVGDDGPVAARQDGLDIGLVETKNDRTI